MAGFIEKREAIDLKSVGAKGMDERRTREELRVPDDGT